ncbi:MAG: HDOD domain-containing protein [Calditrichaeota bacterium]|nr:HDOD domain-containing protein [Calditrichota bacterium]
MPTLAAAEKLGRIVIRSLPTLPSVYYRVEETMRDPDTSAADVARIIESDQSIASKVLKLVNSSYFGFTRKITSLRQAIVMLGFSAVRNALLSISVIKAFGPGNEDFNRKEFWKHALAVAASARFISVDWRLGVHDDAYAAGILHDIGKVVLDQYLHAEFVRSLKLSQREGMSLHEAERRVIGASHCDVGEYLCESWSLPVRLGEAVALHHKPSVIRSDPRLVSVVHVADSMVRQLQLGHSGNYGPIEYNEAALEELNTGPERIADLLSKLRQEFAMNPDLFAIFEGD